MEEKKQHMEETPEEIWLIDLVDEIIWADRPNPHLNDRFGSTRYVRADLIEALKKTPLDHGKLEEVDGYPTTLTGPRMSFTGEVVIFTADELDMIAEQFYNGNRKKLRTWLKKVDKDYLEKSYDEQLRYKTDIVARLTNRRYRR